MNKKQRAAAIVEILKKEYPEATCSLEYNKDYQLLFAARLSAQCTDARVNMVTPKLFSHYKSLEEFASADIDELSDIIRSCGFYNTKAKDIVECAKKLIAEFGGKVPDTMEQLLTLPGVGRKTANLMLGDIFGKPAIVADTHCIRVSNRLGLCTSRDPVKVEMQLKEIIKPQEQSDFCHRLVLHGRAVCNARKPKCDVCALERYCLKKI